MARTDKVKKLEKDLLRVSFELHRASNTHDYTCAIHRYNKLNSKYQEMTGRRYDPTEVSELVVEVARHD